MDDKNSLDSLDSSDLEDDNNDENNELIDSLVKKSLKLIQVPANIKSDEALSLFSDKIYSNKDTKHNLILSNGVYDVTNNCESKLIQQQKSSEIYSNQSIFVPPLKKPKIKVSDTLGKGWFNIQPLKLDESLKRDIKIIEMRNYLDPKRFYKNTGKISKVLHIGTVIEGPHEYKSSRLKKSDRKQTIVDEILADKNITSYSKRKNMEIVKEKTNVKHMGRLKKLKSSKKKVKALF